MHKFSALKSFFLCFCPCLNGQMVAKNAGEYSTFRKWQEILIYFFPTPSSRTAIKYVQFLLIFICRLHWHCADDRCGHDRNILMFMRIWLQSFKDEKPSEVFNQSFTHAIIVVLNFARYKREYRPDIGNSIKDNFCRTESSPLISQHENYSQTLGKFKVLNIKSTCKILKCVLKWNLMSYVMPYQFLILTYKRLNFNFSYSFQVY